jgi:hypothetical protein
MRTTFLLRCRLLAALFLGTTILVALAAPTRQAEAAGNGLPGTPFGTGPAWSPGSEYDRAFDGNTGTFFDYLNPNGGYAGIDLGSNNARTIVKIRFHPRSGFEWRMPGGRFQGSNDGPDSGYVDLYTLPGQPASGWTTVTVSDPTPYRYLRYLAPSDSYGNIAEVEFYDATTPEPVPAPWRNQDVGNTGASGRATFSNGRFEISAAGDGIGGGYDQFHFVYQPMDGDGEIVARLLAIDGTPMTEAALLIRETIDGWPPAREVLVGLTTGSGAFFEARTAPESGTSYTQGPPLAAPAWLKLTRRGSTFTGAVSTDGVNWQEFGSASIAMGDSVYVGLAGGGRTYGQLATSSFDSISFRLLAAGPVAATVNWDSVQSRTSAASYGLNLFDAYNPPDAAGSAYNANLAYMAPGLVRYHSWELMGDAQTTRNGWIDYVNQRWDASKIDAALDALTGIDPTVAINIPAWPTWMDQNGDEFLDADQIDEYAAFCAELVRIVNLEHGHAVRYWEPTNERDDIYYVRFANAGQPDRLDELIAIYNAAANAMKAVDPSILVGGPAFARPDLYPQVERFVAGTVAAGTLDFLSIHGYASGNQGEADRQIYNRAINPTDPTVNSLSSHAADIRAILDTASPNRRIPLWFDEYNISWSFQNNDPRMQSNKGAVFDALMMTALHDAGVDATMAWNEKDGVYGKTDSSNTLRPAAHLFALMNRYAVGERVASSSASPGAVALFAVKSAEHGLRSYLLINRSPVEQQVFTTFGNWQPRYQNLTRYAITAAGYSEGSIAWADMQANGLLLPPHSVTLLVAAERPVRPVLECVAPNADGSYTAYFGYKNDNLVPVSLPIAGQNRFSPLPAERGQPTNFAPGRQVRVFSVSFNGDPLVWTLAGRTATASRNPQQACR